MGAGASGAFEDRFPALFALAYQAAYRVLGDRPAAEDVALEALTRAWSKWSSMSEHAAPWVVRVAGGLAVDEWRRRQRRRRFTGALRAVPEAGDRDLRMDLHRELAALPRRQQQVAVLRYLADLTEAETAERLGFSAGSVKQHSHRALAGLRLRLRRIEADSGEEDRSCTSS